MIDKNGSFIFTEEDFEQLMIVIEAIAGKIVANNICKNGVLIESANRVSENQKRKLKNMLFSRE